LVNRLDKIKIKEKKGKAFKNQVKTETNKIKEILQKALTLKKSFNFEKISSSQKVSF
jgi:hypothetical protein